MKGKVFLMLGVLFGVCAVSSCAFVAQGTESYVFVTKWGERGTAPGQFPEPPTLVTVGSDGNVYVGAGSSIHKFTPGGTFLDAFSPGIPLRGLAADGQGSIYVQGSVHAAAEKQGRPTWREGLGGLFVFTEDGSLLREESDRYFCRGEFTRVNDMRWCCDGCAVAADPGGTIYVCDFQWGEWWACGDPELQDWELVDSYEYYWINGLEFQVGSEDGCFGGSPGGIAVDYGGNIYVADTANHRIQEFTPGGVFLRSWGTAGSGQGRFNGPSGIAVEGSGKVYVADTANHRIQKFTSEGVFLTKWGAEGSGAGEFASPMGVALDSSGIVYVADSNNFRIQKFRPTFAVDRLAYGPAGFTVVWVSQPGKSYQIWQSPDLSAWPSLPITVESQGDSTSWTDDAASHVQRRFYKIELLP